MYNFPGRRPVRSIALGLLLFTAGAGTSALAVQPQPPQAGEAVITIPAGTRIPIRLAQSLDTKRDKPGTVFRAHLSSDVVHSGRVVLPRGAVCTGHLEESKSSGRLRGKAQMQLSLDSIELNGRRYRVVTSSPAFASKGHAKRNAVLIGGGAGTGAAIGAIAGGGIGALIGAGSGAAAGTIGAVATGKRNLHLPAETRVNFTLRRPVTVRMA